MLGPFWNARAEAPTFYNLILFMGENEQNIENWQIKINNFGGVCAASKAL